MLKEREGQITKQACKVISSRTLLFKFESYLRTTLNATDMQGCPQSALARRTNYNNKKIKLQTK